MTAGGFGRAQYERFRSPIDEFAKFAVIGVAGVFITNAVYDLLYIHLGLGPVTSTTIATIVATIVSYLGNRYWSFRDRQRTGVAREIAVFAVLNGIGLLIQDATVACNYVRAGPRARQAGGLHRAERRHRARHLVPVLVLPPVRLGRSASRPSRGHRRPGRGGRTGRRSTPGTPARDGNDRRAGRPADPAKRITR